jgi:hypothetical protein
MVIRTAKESATSHSPCANSHPRSRLSGRSSTEGYCWPYSAKAGETIQFYVSSIDQYMVDIVHLNEQDGVAGVVKAVLNNGDPFLGVDFPDDALLSPGEPWKGCAWDPAAFRVTIGADWTSGLFAARLKPSNTSTDIGTYFYVVFIVRPAQPSADVAVLAHTNTWNAYNDWGGKCQYPPPGGDDILDCARYVSFLRPAPNVFPPKDWIVTNISERSFASGEYWLESVLSDLGVTYEVFSDYDFHKNAVDFKKYKCIALNIHPEYWTQDMRDGIREYVKQGGHIAYLGGNGIWERVEYYPNDPSMLIFREGEDVERGNAYFDSKQCASSGNIGTQPAWDLLGMQTVNSDPFIAPVSILLQDSWPVRLLKIPLPADLTVGRVGRNRPAGSAPASGAAIGWEADRDNLVNLPKTYTIVGKANRSDGVPINTPIIYSPFLHEAKSGWVFSVGSMTFTGSLIVDPILKELLKVTLAEMGAKSQRPGL